jgi:acetyl esterase
MPRVIRLALCTLISALLSPVAAYSQACPQIRVRNPDGNYIIPGVQGDIAYAGDLALDAYVQRGGTQRPSVIVIHGGAWSSGSRVAHVGQILEVLTRAGYNWFSVDYRLGGLARYEDALADLRSALSFIRCRATDLGVDPNQLVLLGEDSGADLAALLAAVRPAGVIGAVLLGGFYDSKKVAAPIVTGMPDLLVVHGGADSEAPIEQARRYCSGVAHAGGRCRFVEAEGASHRVENWWPTQWGYKRDLVDWLSALTHRTFAHQPRDGVVRKDIVYSPSAQLELDAFVPRTVKPVPAVIVVHGGGWEAGDKVTYVTPLFEPLARAGFAWLSIDYRLTPASTNEDQIEDVRQAIRFVRDRHAQFNVDPKRIVLLGESASGQIVMQVAAEDRSIAGVVSFYGVYDFASMVTDASPRSLLVRLFRRTVLDDESRGVLRKYSPQYSAHKGMPPVLLVNGTGERLWPQARGFSRRLNEIGVPHEIVALEGAPHGLENWEGHPEWMFYKQRMVEWIRRIVAQ